MADVFRENAWYCNIFLVAHPPHLPVYELAADGDGRLDGVVVHGLGGVGEADAEAAQTVELNVLENKGETIVGS